MNKILTSITILSIQAFLLLFACTPTTIHDADLSKIYVISLQESWSRLEARALAWQSDAYLTEVTFPIVVGSPQHQEVLVYAFFSSASDVQEMLVVMLDQNNNIHTDISPLSQPISDRPITKSDWQIDSVEALAVMLTGDDIEFLLSHPNNQCSTLDLRRWPNIATKSVVWRILIDDCEFSDNGRYEFIDALNGQRIEQH